MAVTPLRPSDISYLVVHCSATPPNQNIGVPEIDRMHRLKGWIKIGYHFVITRDGTVQKGRSVTEMGAHVENWNQCSLGICMVGGVDPQLKPEANFTEAQYGALRLLLSDLQLTYPHAKVQGHRDFPKVAKACPSFDVKTWLATGKVVP